MQRSLSEEQYKQVVGRCAVEGMQTQDSRSICQLHRDRWLQHYKPTKCAACPQPLSSSAWRPCPEWMREQLGVHHGAFVHKRPCYEKALAASNKQPPLSRWKWSKKTTFLNQLFTSMSIHTQTKGKASDACAVHSQRRFLSPCACRQTKMEEATRNYLHSKAAHLSGLKRRADAAAATSITVPLALMLTELHSREQIASHPSGVGTLSLQLQVDKGTEITKGLLKVINVKGHVQQQNLLPIFHYVGDENYTAINNLMKPLLSQLEEFALPSSLNGCFFSTLKVLGADIKALQITLGLSPSSSSTFPCPHCLIPLNELRSLAGVTQEYPLRNSLLHGADHLDLQMDRNGDITFAKEYHNCIHPPPFIYGLPQMHRNIVIGMSVLHISIGLGNKLLKLVRTLSQNEAAFNALLSQHRLSFYKYHGETLRGPQVHRLLSGKEPLYLKVLEAVKEVRTRDSFIRGSKIIVSQSSPLPSPPRVVSAVRCLLQTLHC